MENKKAIAFIMIGSVVLILSIVLLCNRDKIREKLSPRQTKELTPTGEELSSSPEEPEGGWTDPYADEMLDGDLTEWLSPYRVAVLNKGFLGDNGLNDKGLANLEPALSTYLDKVDPDGGNYYVEADETFFKDDPTWCGFYIIITELDVKVRCVYTKGDVSGYNFYSLLDKDTSEQTKE